MPGIPVRRDSFRHLLERGHKCKRISALEIHAAFTATWAGLLKWCVRAVHFSAHGIVHCSAGLFLLLLETLCCECKDGMCPLCCQYAQITETYAASVVVIVFSITAPLSYLANARVLGICPSSSDQHALCPLNADHSCC